MDLQPKRYKEIDFDNPQNMKLALKNIKQKKCLYDLYKDTYKMMVDLGKKYLCTDSNQLEIGSGGGFMKEWYPYITTSDVMKTDNVNMTVDAQDLPFENNKLGIIYAMHVIHHIPDITKFLDEADRVLVQGGGLVIMEPL